MTPTEASLTKGVIDEPRDKRKKTETQEDLLDVDDYAKALAKFIQNSATPITIGIQGEWGSGKTSLLYSIWSELQGETELEGESSLPIWINSWEHSLLATPEQSLIGIIGEITEKIGTKENSLKDVKKFTKKLAMSAARLSLGMAAGNRAAAEVDEWLGGQATIKELRAALEKLINARQDVDQIIVFVDDLDRIEPANAVRVLELLKNIFNLSKCVFVLAIDYNVVVKGLEAKYGKKDEKNEWEFRAFFDKIIQLPFMMPLANYTSGSYLTKLLVEVGFLEEQSELKSLSQILGFSIGNNPRSIKRLVNSVALISLLDDIGERELLSESAAEKQVFIGLLALQICAPGIYEMLKDDPKFDGWTEEETALRVTQGHEGEMEGFDKQYSQVTSAGAEFKEEWQKVLYRVCYVVPNRRRQVQKLSKLLSLFKQLCADTEENGEGLDIEKTIKKGMDWTAITNISTESAPAPPTRQRLSGKWLKEKYSLDTKVRNWKPTSKIYVNAEGNQYTKIKKERENFPGYYCDENGYFLFKTIKAYKEFLDQTGNASAKKTTVTLNNKPLSKFLGYEKFSEDAL